MPTHRNASPFASRNISPIVVDLETVGLPNAADYLDPVQPDKRLKDPEKIAADLAQKAEDRLSKLALDWNVGRIAVLGWQTEDELDPVVTALRDEQDERSALLDFWPRVKHRTLIGFNIKGFDLRYLIQRSRYLRVPHPVLDLGKYAKQGIVDLFLDLTFTDGHHDSGAMRRTLHAFCRRFGIDVQDASTGADVAALLASGEWQAVIDHCRSDVRLTWALAERLGYVAVRQMDEPRAKSDATGYAGDEETPF